MADRFIDIKTIDGQEIEVEAWKTRSPNLWLVASDDQKSWTIAFFKTGATLGRFQRIRDAQYVVGVLIALGLDHADALVRGKEWDKYHNITEEIKNWLLLLTNDRQDGQESDQ